MSMESTQSPTGRDTYHPVIHKAREKSTDMSVKASDIKLEIQRIPVTRKKRKITEIPTEPRLHIRCTSITYGTQAPSTMRKASNTTQKHHS